MSSSGQYQVATIMPTIGGGGIQFSNNYGSSWTNLTPASSLYKVSMSASGQYITIVQYQGSIYVSSNFGSSWNQVVSSNLFTSNYYSSVSVSASGKYQSVAFNYSNYNASIAISSDYGVTWSVPGPLWSTSSSGGISIAVSASGQFQTIVSPGNLCFVSSNYAASFTQVSLSTGSNSCSVAMSASGQYQTIVVTNGSGSNNVFKLFSFSKSL